MTALARPSGAGSPGQLAGTAARWGQAALTSLTLPVLILAAWQLVTATVRSPFFPEPTAIFQRAGQLWLSGPPSHAFLTSAVYTDVLPSLERVLLGWGIAAAIGISVGIAVGLWRALGDYLSPLVEFLRSVPAPATLPLFIILFKGTDTMRVLLIVFGVVWGILINTISGVEGIDPALYEMGRAFRVSRLRQAFLIMLPAAAPKIFAGLRVAMTGAVLLMVVSEFFLSTNGVGYELVQAQAYYNFTDMWATMILLAVFGLVLNTLLELVERRVLEWHRTSRA